MIREIFIFLLIINSIMRLCEALHQLYYAVFYIRDDGDRFFAIFMCLVLFYILLIFFL